jgi:hypothetical protein
MENPVMDTHHYFNSLLYNVENGGCVDNLSNYFMSVMIFSNKKAYLK